MKHLHFECVGGASGDMILGALVELGVPVADLAAALETLGAGAFELEAARGESMHITGLRLSVKLPGQAEASAPAEPHVPHHHHDHDHDHDHDHHHDHGHAPSHEHDDEHHHHHEHRALAEIEALVLSSALPEKVKANTVHVFRALGEAEAKIHGVPLEKIHFHEVGALDSILDITGSCWALDRLGIDSVSVGSLPLGQGVIRCAHGVYPNPAPATRELMAGMNVTPTDEPFELVTPTGAALLACWKNRDAAPEGAVLVKTAYSLGQRQLHHRPNLLCASLYETGTGEEHDACLVLECNLDDMTPELVGVLVDEVLAAGALDVTVQPVTMKKQRPGFIFSVLCEPAARERVLDTLFRGSTTFGVREHPVRRTKLARRFEKVATPYGEIRIKVGTWKGRDITRAPEMADCLKRAAEKGVPVREVYEAALRA